MKTRITVLGAGPGGYVAAVRAAQLGAKVTLVEKEQLGGTCLNWGCIPSKIMKTSAELLGKCRQADEFGVRVEGSPKLDLEKLMARKKKVLASQIKGIEGLLSHHKIDLVRGHARIEGRGKVTVTNAEADVLRLEWDRLIIATGSKPFSVPSFPFDGKRILSSNDILSIEHLPESIVIIGGGVIGCEFACILSAMGTKVTVVEAMERMLPLPSLEASCSKTLEREMKKRKIKYYVNRVVESIEEEGDALKVTIGPSPLAADLKEKDREPIIQTAEKALVCIGRSPNTENIGLSNLDVKTDAKGWILVNERLETTISDVYAIGDVLGPEKVMLAHVASTEAVVAVENAMGSDRKMDYTAIPGAVFTIPEVACVGLTKAQAENQGMNARSDTVLFRNIGKAQVMGELAGQATVVSDADTGKMLGVHIIGPHATDLLGEGGLAITSGLKVADLAQTVHAHPTLSEIMLEVALKASDAALHG